MKALVHNAIKLILVSILSSFLVTTIAYSQTPVGGTYSWLTTGPLVLTSSGNPYVATSDIYIDGTQFTIQSGVEINLNGHGIYVYVSQDTSGAFYHIGRMNATNATILNQNPGSVISFSGVQQNGINYYAEGTLTNCTFQRVRVDCGWYSRPTITGATMNNVDNTGTAVTMTGPLCTATVSNSTISGYELPFAIANAALPTITGNTVSGCRYQSVGLSGEFTGNYTLPNYGYSYRLVGLLSITGGSTFTITSGLTLTNISAYGPVAVYAWNGSTYATARLNATNVTFIGDDLGPLLGQQISFYGEQQNGINYYAEGTLTNCTFQRVRVDCGRYSRPTITGTTIRDTQDGIQITDNGSPTVTQTNFIQVSGYGVQNSGSSNVTATNNYWDHPTGPQHPSNPNGQGCLVSNGVSFIPFLTSPSSISQIPILITVLDHPGGNPIIGAKVTVAHSTSVAYASLLYQETQSAGNVSFIVPIGSDISIFISASNFDPQILTVTNLFSSYTATVYLQAASGSPIIRVPAIISGLLAGGTTNRSAVCSAFDTQAGSNQSIPDYRTFVFDHFNSRNFDWYLISAEPPTGSEVVPATLAKPQNPSQIRDGLCNLVDLLIAVFAPGGGMFTEYLNPFCIGSSLEPSTVVVDCQEYVETSIVFGLVKVRQKTGTYACTLSAIDQFVVDQFGRATGSYYQNGLFVEDKFEIPSVQYSGHESHPNLLTMQAQQDSLTYLQIPRALGPFTHAQGRVQGRVFELVRQDTAITLDPRVVPLRFPDSLSTPVAAIHIGIDTLTAGGSQSFSAHGSVDPRSLPLRYEWWSGNQLLSQDSTFTRQYTTPGLNTVLLKAINTDGIVGTATRAFYVVNTSGIVISLSLPEILQLYQNYPNPFNPTTTIAFDLPVTSPVRLEVFNLLGQNVQTLINETLKPGSYSYPFHGKHLASGVYFYRLTTGQRQLTKKLLLLK